VIGLLQRVCRAHVEIEGKKVAEIESGLLVFVGVEKNDTQSQADRLLERLLKYRIFADDTGKMNLSLKNIQAGLLLVPQFTLAADTRKGRRPSFASAAPPEQGERFFDYLLERAYAAHPIVDSGVFGDDMQVNLVNDGPVTFWLQVN
jgi:D-tyrosyl-tRNA(Tyr) deacylase